MGSKAFCRRDSGLRRGVELRSTKYSGWYVGKKWTRTVRVLFEVEAEMEVSEVSKKNGKWKLSEFERG